MALSGLHPWWPLPVHPHPLFEVLAYTVAWRMFVRDRARHDPLEDAMQRATLLTVGVLGGALGAKLSWWLEDPVQTWAHLSELAWMMQGRSIVGALLGALWSVEAAKVAMGVRVATGDAYVGALGLGLAVGRLGCFFAGVTDGTHGDPTSLPWGLDLGDGVLRHPTALYEIAVLVALHLGLSRWSAPREGDRFKAWMVAYLSWRLLIEPCKTQPALALGLTGIQWQCLAGLAWYAGALLVRLRERLAARSSGS